MSLFEFKEAFGLNRETRRKFNLTNEIIDAQRMAGARYALKLYRQAVQIALGVGEKRLERVDKKFCDLCLYDEVLHDMKLNELRGQHGSAQKKTDEGRE